MLGDISLWNVQGPLLHSGDHIVPCIWTVDYTFKQPSSRRAAYCIPHGSCRSYLYAR